MPGVRVVRGVVVLSAVVAAMVVSAISKPGPGAQPSALAPHQQLLREIYQELIEINTTNSVGDNTKAAEAMARRLLAAGFPPADVQVLAPAPRKGNLVARLRGTGVRRPLLLLAHLDVVEANREDWSVDPFKLLEQDGYFYGRGTTDDKAMAAAFVANLIRYRQEGFAPDRDLILALTADEEGGGHNGVAWLLKEHRALIDAELALNEGARRLAEERPARGQQRAGEREDRPELSARGDQPRRAQLAAHQGQRDLAPCRRPGATGRLRFSGQPRRGESPVLRVGGHPGRRVARRRHPGRRARRSRPDRRGAGRCGKPALQRAPADDMRRDAARGRPRRQCACRRRRGPS